MAIYKNKVEIGSSSNDTNNLYLHIITFRGGYYTDKLTVNILDDNAHDLTLAQIQNYIKTNYSFTKSDGASNNYGLIGTGISGSNTESNISAVLSVFWATDISKFVFAKYKQGAMPEAVELNELTILRQKTILVALNNVNKGSVKTYTSSVVEGSTSVGTMNWTCVKTPVSSTRYKYSWNGYLLSSAYSQSEGGTGGSMYLSPKFRVDLPNANMIGKCTFNASLKNQTCMTAYSQGTNQTCEFYMIRATQVSTNAVPLEICINCEYISE